MTQFNQFGRKLSLVVSGVDGAGLDLSQFKVKFNVRQYELNTPTNLMARVYNLSANTSKKIQSEFTRVSMKAGYENGNYGTIFSGAIKYFGRGKENAVDSYLDIFAADEDEAINFAIVTKTLSAEATSPSDQLAVIKDSYSEYGVGSGFQCDLPVKQNPRGKTMFGMADDAMREICNSNEVSASIVDGKLQMIQTQSFAPDPIVILTSLTGMIGIPEQTPDGINIMSLLNPNIRAGRRVQIDNTSINQLIKNGGSGLTLQYTPYNQYTGLESIAAVEADGIYKVLYVEHNGDTRGNQYYTKMICVGLSDRTPQAIVERGLG